jgi:hypothetical protein
MTRYVSPAQARQDRIRWRRMLRRFARAARPSGSTGRRREPGRPEVIVCGPCGGNDARPTPSRSRRPIRRRDRQPTRDAEMEAGG